MDTGPIATLAARAAAGHRDPAVIDRDGTSCWGEFAARISTFAGGLRALGVARGDRVGLLLGNSADFAVAAYGCLVSGAAFVPLPVADPPARVRRMVADSRPALVVARRDLLDGITEVSSGACEAAHVEATGGSLPLRSPDPKQPAYIVYTSGSTAAPKGVVIRYESLVNLTAATVEVFSLDSTTRALCVSPFHFDGAFGSLFSVPAAGGTIVILGNAAPLPADLVRAVLEHRITHTSFSPSLLRLLVGSHHLDKLGESSLRTVGIGGEDCTLEDVRAIKEAVPGLRLFNRYGPTETTVVVSSFEVTDEALKSSAKLPIGRPHRGVSFHLVGPKASELTGSGVVGELHVGGIQVMEGYWGAPGQTAAALRTDVVPGATVYRTGDLAERNEAGDYVFRGRADEVLKRSGNRVGAAEVEMALRGLPSVREAACAVVEVGCRQRLLGFVVAEGKVPVAQLRGELLEVVPPYMCPDRFHLVDVIPLTSAGKADLNALCNANIGSEDG
jgi:D-alanine--poly(phosphoribitol) ligase subunit 1